MEKESPQNPKNPKPTGFEHQPTPCWKLTERFRAEVCPLIHRAMKERSAEMKRKGAQIVGAMVLLIKARAIGLGMVGWGVCLVSISWDVGMLLYEFCFFEY